MQEENSKIPLRQNGLWNEQVYKVVNNCSVLADATNQHHGKSLLEPNICCDSLNGDTTGSKTQDSTGKDSSFRRGPNLDSFDIAV